VTTTAPQTQISGFRVALETCLSLKYLVFLSFRHKNTHFTLLPVHIYNLNLLYLLWKGLAYDSPLSTDSDTGGWGPWSEWTPCSTNCLGGTRNRYRFCDSPPPRYGAKFCEVSNPSNPSNPKKQLGRLTSERPLPPPDLTTLIVKVWLSALRND